ncbi:MAG TPA: hypothetical protein VF173_23710 [Thermoanaerobaculia bacterium]|nr:hypothetical protein [Thermoanaerobaculia bacterium]
MMREPASSRATVYAAPAEIDRLQRLGLVAGSVALAVCLLGLWLSPQYFFRSWLVGWVFWMGVTLGCLAISLLHHLTRGAWGLVIRRVLEAASRTLPLLLVLSLPLLFGLKDLYEWARPEAVRHDALLQAKAPYLNAPFFVTRLLIYFLIWGGVAFLMSHLSQRQDREADPGLTRKMQLIAAPALAAYCLAVTFAAVDWLMSLQPHWFSTIYGVYLMGSQGLAALAFLIVFGLWLSRREPMSAVLQPRHFHDWGKLFFAFVMLWAYFSFSQFLIIWAGNLPEEISFYLPRMRGAWGIVFLAIALFHFLLPFLLLLSRDLKRDGRRLVGVAVLMLVMRWVDLVWQVEPAFAEKNAGFYWLYLAAPVALGGFWLAWFVRELKKRPLLPINDPYLPEAIAHHE